MAIKFEPLEPWAGGGDPNPNQDKVQGKTQSNTQKEAKAEFLDQIAVGQSVRAAAAAIGIKPSLPYNWRKQDETFAAAWSAAEEAGTDIIEEEAFRRAVTGVEKPVYRGGEIVGHVADYSDAMLMFLLKSRRPDRYGTTAKTGGTKSIEDLNLEGARDALVGWVCGLSLAWHFIGYDLLNWLRLAFFADMPEPPALNGTETLVTVLMAMLGLGGLRTVEKLKGVGRDGWRDR